MKKLTAEHWKSERAMFEDWFKSFFEPLGSERWSLVWRNDSEGYEDSMVNSMWIGFCAGRELGGSDE